MFENTYIVSTGKYLPGPAINNEEMDRYIAPVNSQSQRIKRRILAENGIITRHYGINSEGRSVESASGMAAKAITEALVKIDYTLHHVDYLACATVGGDLATPGFANQVQGYLHAPPMQTLSVQGVCASGVQALKAAAHSVEMGDSTTAVVVACEFPSRLFKKARFQKIENKVDFDSHFLRWMLSDGAGACVLTRDPRPGTLALKLKWIHTRSFSGDYPTCMRIGSSQEFPDKSYLDYPNLSEVDEAGAFLLRQDIRLLPNIFDVGISEFAELVKAGKIEPHNVDHFLCHYSSEKFSGVIKELLRKSEMEIPHDRWFSNLKTAGNTGSASIFVMLDEFLKTKTVKPGEKILCFITESARFTSCYIMMEAEQIEENSDRNLNSADLNAEVPAQSPAHATPELARTLRELSSIWHQYRSRVFRSSLVNKIYESKFSKEDYLHWMSNWIPQVREGSLWMREAIASLPHEFSSIGKLITTHANEEQFDFKILYDDYVKAGGAQTLDELKRNAGGEALNSYMYARAREKKSYGLLGGIFIIEGTGQKIIPTLLPLIKRSLNLNMGAFRFLEYHGENDVEHMKRWIQGMEILHALTDSAGDEIITTARAVSDLYSIQWELASS